MADADWVKYKQIRGGKLPASIDFEGVRYRLLTHFKRDFYAATGLYERDVAANPFEYPHQVVLKIYHTEPLWHIPLGWLGHGLCRREVFYYDAVAGIQGLGRLLGRYGASGYVREFVPGCHLREYRKTHTLDRRFYVQLKEQLAHIHARGIAHNDLSKPENVLVRPDGTPTIIDFQIAARFAWRLPLFKQLGRAILRYLQSLDRYHLDKLHRRARPQDFTPEELEKARKKGPLLYLHGLLLRRPYRAVRHLVMARFLRLSEPPITSGGNATTGTGSSHSETASTRERAA